MTRTNRDPVVTNVPTGVVNAALAASALAAARLPSKPGLLAWLTQEISKEAAKREVQRNSLEDPYRELPWRNAPVAEDMVIGDQYLTVHAVGLMQARFPGRRDEIAAFVKYSTLATLLRLAGY